MAFLNLNGWQIPIRKGGQRQPVIIGERARSFNGTWNVDRRELFDKWMFETTELRADDAEALVGLLQGRGHSWPYDADLYSGKGLGPGSTSGTIVPAKSMSPVSDIIGAVGGQPESFFASNGSLAVEAAATNILPSATARASSASGFSTVGGGSLALDTTYYAIETFEGTLSAVKHTRTALGQGVQTNGQSCGASTRYVGSVYLMTLDTGITVTVDLDDDVDNIDGAPASLQSGVWQRVQVYGTTDPAASTISISVTVTGGAAAGDIYIDALQIEPSDDVATTWFDTSRSSKNLEYDTSMFEGADGFTFAAWIKMDSYSGFSLSKGIFNLHDTSNSEAIRAARGAGTDNLSFLVSSGGSTVVNQGITGAWDNDWHHVAMTVGRTIYGQFAGNTLMVGYYDGGQVAAAFGFQIPNLEIMTRLAIGNYGTAGASLRLGGGAMMDEVIVLPFAASANMIAGLASQQTEQPPALPKLLAEGSTMHRAPGFRHVEGRVVNRIYNPIYLDGGWQDNAQRIQFELES